MPSKARNTYLARKPAPAPTSATRKGKCDACSEGSFALAKRRGSWLCPKCHSQPKQPNTGRGRP
jgi:ribosomal protein S27AE